jgi:hypothetical protein
MCGYGGNHCFYARPTHDLMFTKGGVAKSREKCLKHVIRNCLGV